MAATLGTRQTAAAARRTLPQVPGTRPVVLIAEDDEDTRFMLRTLLGRGGYAVVEAADGEQAVAAAERERPDLILMGGSLPRLDGPAAVRRIRQLDSLAAVPV